MEKHKCKLCLRKFPSGRALGGHVRSHMMNLSPPQKTNFFIEESEDDEEIESLPSSNSFTSSSSESSSESENEQEEEVDHGGVEVIVQDRESESETSRNIFCRQTTKRVRSSRVISGTITTTTTNQFCNLKKDSIFMQPTICKKQGKSSSLVEESPPLSSISQTTSEEDVAYCLMLLSRDKWIKMESFEDQESAEEEEGVEEKKQEIGVGVKVTKSRSRGKYRCETCEKVFRSYQALGGHRASHKRIKLNNFSSKAAEKEAAANGGGSSSNVVVEQKLHECPVCFKVFSSGQALGGHKRSHNVSSLNLSASTPTTTTTVNKLFPRSNGEALIDLNLPAPIDDEDEQFSAVSDVEFANPYKL